MQIDAQKLRLYSEAYGIAVRAGVITPNRDDEAHFRNMFGLPKLNNEVDASWDDSDGVRAPITLAKGVQEVAEQPIDESTTDAESQ